LEENILIKSSPDISQLGQKVLSHNRLTMFSGKNVSITGRIELYQEKPEIHILRADQIKVLHSQTEH
jgi:DNA/RNA endonuclease YhcR with UshA esterase domain